MNLPRLIRDVLLALFMLLFFSDLQGEELKKFRLKSQSFEENGAIPTKYTCDGLNISPALSWEFAPLETKSFVLFLDDPDALEKTWVHWVVYNIPSTVFSCNEGESPLGSLQGLNDLGETKYEGPCPPSGTHRYFFKLYALKQTLNLSKGATRKQVEDAMQPLILGETELMGTYSRQ